MDGQGRVADEFVCPEALRGPLSSQQDTVERIFGVSFTIGAGNTPYGAGGQMWLQLRGSDRDVKAAKMFVRGLVTQEEHQEVSYPAVLNCVFCGARGFFMDCMIKSTSAHIAVVSPGVLLISGLAEPVVCAYSRVADLLERYKWGQASSSDTDERGSGELCYSRRAFKALVEKREDRHILDLLVLPRSVKEALLDLVKDAELVSNLTPGQAEEGSHESSRSGTTLGGPGEDQSEAPREAAEEKRPERVATPAEVGGRHADGAGCAQPKGDDDFVLGVLKQAAVSCGYTEHKVAQACSMLLDGSTHLLLMELQKEIEDSVKKGQKPAVAKENERRVPFGPVGRQDTRDSEEPNQTEPGANPDLVCTNEALPPPRPDPVKGPPGPTYAHIPCPKPKRCPNAALQAQRSLTGSGESGGAPGVPSVVVTGKQRFLEGLQTPFKLQLTDRPGNPKLRTVIIDGSNVAMSHGRSHFFSCRGIALAVQHFWERGHRQISALLPQWRQKSDSRIRATEQHFLGELQKLGLLSFTPSREVLGTRISSYDDRLMLQLAQKTEGVIVTNDNLRDLLDESVEWRDIIKKRLLQYTFVGDHFMVPDDPLGRGGPHLDHFLSLEHRTPDPGNHSFAGVATNSSPVNPPSSQIQVHNFPGTLNGADEGSQSHGQEMGRVAGHQHAKSGYRGPADRTMEATASLRERLCQVFPGQDNTVMLVLQSNPTENDLNVLSALLLE
ncbi:NEDD4-binding protein 1 [Phyllopteryx taeniolatus]|uniref:NEDD4-binding protein 1 n=1 Tax=Phyllopteryx taeniolatus TaxID=161469 RepID=UPI002AD241E1|nr:NEDD4-binding protein 1 [Phyllopteryx taeniolatus]